MFCRPPPSFQEGIAIAFTASEDEATHRLDTVVSGRFPQLSRSQAGRLIREGHVTVNGVEKKAGYVVKVDDTISVSIPSPEPILIEPEPIPLSILFEDKDVVVVNKPPGMVVHPGAGHHHSTLVHALLHHCKDLEGIGGMLRPGIVHRLDKDTSGCVVVAKNDVAHDRLSQQFKQRLTRKCYLALVYGEMKALRGVIDHPIGRHPSDRKKMSTKSRHSRQSETRWQVKEAFHGATLLEIDLKTGRTHQIRVHCAAIGHPVAGDRTYGGAKRWKTLPTQDLQAQFKSIKRHMLHAWKLTIYHPRTDKPMDFESPIPKDMISVLDTLRCFKPPSV